MITGALLIILGLITGVLSGVIGIGGGVFIVPSLIYIFGLSQLQAQGTTLALLIPPIGLFAVLTYFKQGYVDLRIATLIALGFLIGGFFGARIAVQLPAELLRRVFGFFLLLIALRMLFFK